MCIFPRRATAWQLNKFLNSQQSWHAPKALFKNLFNKQKTNSIYCEIYRFRVELGLYLRLQIKCQVILNGDPGKHKQDSVCGHGRRAHRSRFSHAIRKRDGWWFDGPGVRCVFYHAKRTQGKKGDISFQRRHIEELN